VIIPSLLRWSFRQSDPSFVPFLTLLHLGTAGALLFLYRADWFRLAAAFRRASLRGDRLLQRALSHKGVQRPIIAAVLEEETDQQALARSAAAKKARALAAEADPVFIPRLTAFLLRRGFDYDVASGVVHEFLKDRA